MCLQVQGSVRGRPNTVAGYKQLEDMVDALSLDVQDTKAAVKSGRRQLDDQIKGVPVSLLVSTRFCDVHNTSIVCDLGDAVSHGICCGR